MKKLELKHLANAFCNNQKFVYYDNERELNQICNIVELKAEEITISNGECQYDVYFDEVKLILRPLLDLTKEDINSFTVNVRLALRECSSEKLLSRACHCELQWLSENHYDIYGLIENNLAIDMNTLK